LVSNLVCLFVGWLVIWLVGNGMGIIQIAPFIHNLCARLR